VRRREVRREIEVGKKRRQRRKNTGIVREPKRTGLRRRLTRLRPKVRRKNPIIYRGKVG